MPLATEAKRELPLANSMGELDTCDRDRRIGERFQSLHRGAARLYCAMILFDDVVEVF
jgi:hypothetical protein